MKLKIAVSVFVICVLLCGTSSGQTLRMKDHSDWWSILNETFRAPVVKSQSKDLDPSNFRIAGVDLGDEFAAIATRLGKTIIVQRGDASTGREQSCYVSVRNSPKTYLIFEFGEVGSIFYLFADGPVWKGKNLCARSSHVSESLSTASGLRLGMQRSQVEAILGPADVALDDRLVHSREIEKRTTPEQFEQQRKQYPEPLTDAQAHKEFDFYSEDMYIEVRFTGGRLSYLAVSRSDTD